MAEASPDFLVELHQDLSRKWKLHGTKIEKIWRSMNQKTRLEAIKAGAADGVVLKNSSDSSLGSVHKFIPEWNTQEVAAAGPDFLLDMLRHRATETLEDQYHSGFNGRPGDYELIVHSMQTKNLCHKEPFEDCYTFFLNGEMYGRSYKVLQEKEETLKGFGPAIKAGVCIPQAVGELVLLRQTYILQCLNIIIGDILMLGSKTRDTKNVNMRAVVSAAESMSKLGIKDRTKAELPDIISTASDRSSALEAHLELLRTEPVALEYAINLAFYTRPEIVPDERGRSMPSLQDKFISGAVMDAVHGAVKNVVTWTYIGKILGLYVKENDKALRATIAQELANICNQEHARSRNALKRALATSLGTKWFKRLNNGSDNGVARLAIKGDPSLLLREDPLLHHLLRLCQPETTAAKAIDWIQQLDRFRQSHPMDWERVVSVAYYALGDLITIVFFAQSLGQAISLPAFSRNKGQQFVAETSKLETDMNKIKSELDLTEFAAPLDMLLEPGMAEQALEKLDDFVVEKTGAQMGFLYEDLMTECISSLEQIKNGTSKGSQGGFVPLPNTDAVSSGEAQIEQRREKVKTRPPQSSALDITSTRLSETSAEDAASHPEVVGAPRISVKSTTVKTFATIFAKYEKRSPITWTAFEAAMADVGFSVIPREGSIYTFEMAPDSVMDDHKAKSKQEAESSEDGEKNKSSGRGGRGHSSITIHRPHQSIVEGYDLLHLAGHLRRRFGWHADTFEVSQ